MVKLIACLTPTMEAEGVPRGSFPCRAPATGPPAGGGHGTLKHEQMDGNISGRSNIVLI